MAILVSLTLKSQLDCFSLKSALIVVKVLEVVLLEVKVLLLNHRVQEHAVFVNRVKHFGCLLMRGRAVVARQAHNLEDEGSNPSPAT